MPKKHQGKVIYCENCSKNHRNVRGVRLCWGRHVVEGLHFRWVKNPNAR